MKVFLLRYNWRHYGTTKEGLGEDYNERIVGHDGVLSIKENPPCDGMPLNYEVHFDNGQMERVFNPNLVRYSK